MHEVPGQRPISEDALTASARVVLDFAKAEARALNHHYVGTEHILLGLSREADGPAGRVLSTRVGLEALRTQVEKVIGRGETTPDGPLPLTSRAAKVLDLGAWVSNTPVGVLCGWRGSGENLVCQTMSTTRACSR